ncbi:hypothetical protein D3C81_1841000 [compost metagenome]
MTLQQRAQRRCLIRIDGVLQQCMQGVVVTAEDGFGVVEFLLIERVLERIQMGIERGDGHGVALAGCRCSWGMAFHALSISVNNCRASSNAL